MKTITQRLIRESQKKSKRSNNPPNPPPPPSPPSPPNTQKDQAYNLTDLKNPRKVNVFFYLSLAK